MAVTKYRAAELATEIMRSLVQNPNLRLNGATGMGMATADAAKEDGEYLSILFTHISNAVHAAGGAKD